MSGGPRLDPTATSRICSKCHIVKPLDAFYRDKRCVLGCWAKCKECHKAWGKQYNIANVEKLRARRKINYQATREQRLAYGKAYRLTHRESGNLARRRNRIKYLYNLSLSGYAQMFAEQNGRCAICKRPELRLKRNGSPFNLSIDHDHKTDKVRNLLCYTCNSILGYVQEDILIARSVVAYLERWGIVDDTGI